MSCASSVQLNGLLEQQEKDRRERRKKMVSGSDLVSALRQERRELESKCAGIADRLKKVREETAFLWVSCLARRGRPAQLGACSPSENRADAVFQQGPVIPGVGLRCPNSVRGYHDSGAVRRSHGTMAFPILDWVGFGARADQDFVA